MYVTKLRKLEHLSSDSTRGHVRHQAAETQATAHVVTSVRHQAAETQATAHVRHQAVPSSSIHLAVPSSSNCLETAPDVTLLQATQSRQQ